MAPLGSNPETKAGSYRPAPAPLDGKPIVSLSGKPGIPVEPEVPLPDQPHGKSARPTPIPELPAS